MRLMPQVMAILADSCGFQETRVTNPIGITTSGSRATWGIAGFPWDEEPRFGLYRASVCHREPFLTLLVGRLAFGSSVSKGVGGLHDFKGPDTVEVRWRLSLMGSR